MNFEQRIRHFIRKNQLIAPRGQIIIGVSGGADSMALLVVLAGLRHDLGVNLHVAHFNHRFRPESGRDEAFVARWCQQLNVPLIVGRRAGGVIKSLSEDDARQMRFKFFIQTAKKFKAQAVVLAHTRNDLAETVLMRLMRGSGLYGLRAILPSRSIDGVAFVRPLLGVTRTEVENYLKSKKVPFCTDTTNRQVKYERNRVRRELLPLLAKEYNPQVIDALSDLAMTAGDDYEFLAMHAHKQFQKSCVVSRRKVGMNLKSIHRQHPAIVRLVLRQMVESLTKDPAALTFEHIHALENLLQSQNRSSIDLSHQLKASKDKASLYISRASAF